MRLTAVPASASAPAGADSAGARQQRPAPALAPAVRPELALGLTLAVSLACVAAAALVAGVDPVRVLVLLAVAPLVEETLFRAGLHDALRRHAGTARLANAATALAFGAVHAVVRADIAAFAVAIPALAIGWVYERTGRVRHCVALHAAMNAAWLAWMLADPAARLGP